MTVPAARAAVVHSLAKRGLSQTRIAKAVGIAQPAVNKYLSGKYSKRIKGLERLMLRRKMVGKAVRCALAGKRAGTKRCIDLMASDRAVINAAMRL